MRYEDWQGELVIIERTLPGRGVETVGGKVKASKNGALILLPQIGKKMPIFIEYSEIKSIRSDHLKKSRAAKVDRNSIREHMFTAHGWNSPYSTPDELLIIHARMHKESDEDVDGAYGHIHL